MIHTRALGRIMSSREEIDLLASFFGKCLKMYKVSFFTNAVESYDTPFWRSLSPRNSVLGSARIKRSDVLLGHSARTCSLEQILKRRIFCLAHLLCQEYDASEMAPDGPS